MSDPSVEEIVAWIERRLNDGMSPVYLPAHLCRALIADWRKRGEALLPFASAVDGYRRTRVLTFCRLSWRNEMPATSCRAAKDGVRTGARYRVVRDDHLAYAAAFDQQPFNKLARRKRLP